MTPPNTTIDPTSERRAALLREAERQGIRPLRFDELLSGDFWNEDDERDETFDEWLRRTRAEGDRREAG